MRAILIDPYDRSVKIVDYQGYEDICKQIDGPPDVDGAASCDIFCHQTLGGGVHAYLDDNGNWTQEAWFRQGPESNKILYCGRMLLVGGTSDGEDADLPDEVTTYVVEGVTHWLDDAAALEWAKACDSGLRDAAEASDVPIIHLDEGLAERIAEVVERKQQRGKRFVYIQVDGIGTHELDEEVNGSYAVWIDATLTGEAAEEAALNAFHAKWPIKVLEDFEFSVVDPVEKANKGNGRGR